MKADFNKDAKPSDFKVGQRVEFHPCTDLWMSGCRYGEVRKVYGDCVFVKPDAGAFAKEFNDMELIRPA